MQFISIIVPLLGFLLSFSAHAEEVSPTAAPPSETAPAQVPPPPVAASEPVKRVYFWYRDSAEYLASKSTRAGLPTDVNTKVITDAKRFDVSVGKRIPLFRWAEDGRHSGWSAGVDGGMLASLVRYTSNGKLTFATNTFDGFFGMYIGHSTPEGWLGIFRVAHLSAHLVDNSPRFLTPIAYSQFWNEIIVGKSFPRPTEISDWDLHLQANLGVNNTSVPVSEQPRAGFGVDFGHALHGPNSLAILASADANRAGVKDQLLTYAFFLGMGFLKRPHTIHRPVRAGLAYFRGSDYRNQLFQERQNWLTFEVATEF